MAGIAEIAVTNVPDSTKEIKRIDEKKHANMRNPLRNEGYPKRNCVSSWEPIRSAAK